MSNNTRIPLLFQRLKDAGFDRAYVRKAALPDWWDESVLETTDGYAQTLTLLSRNLGLDLRSLQNAEVPVACREFGVTCFKKKQNDAEDDVKQAQCIAARAAQLVSHALPLPFTAVPPGATEIRATICKGMNQWVDFEGLLDYCWDIGIPVLHVSRFPKGAHKMDGMAARIKGRPVIVLSKNSHYSALLLFVLAHELGHIASGHLAENGLLIDEKIENDDDNEHEIAANAFAVELLTGSPDRAYRAVRNMTAQQLADAAQRVSEREGVYPGVVALNYAWNKGQRVVGQAALALLEPEANAVAAVHARMRSRLDWERLPAESRRFLLYVTGADKAF